MAGVGFLPGIEESEQVMRDHGQFSGGGLGGPDVEALIDLKRITVDDFAAKFQRQADGEVRFTRRGGSGDYHQRVGRKIVHETSVAGATPMPCRCIRYIEEIRQGTCILRPPVR